MVKLTRILKQTEYRDDVASKRNRRNNKKKSGKDSDRVSQTMSAAVPESSLRGDASQATGRKEVNLPPALMSIIMSTVPGHTTPAPAVDEQREQPEPQAPSISGSNPHHFALTRAAQMALRTMPQPGDSEDNRSQSSTMALIDSIVKTSDDPALIEALQAMMVDANGQSVHQRETLALVAESIMEKKAAKEALQRAVLAESRLQESLKRCAPELVGDTAALVAAAEVDASTDADAASTPVATTSANNNGTGGGFFHRINRSLTGNSKQNPQRRIAFGRKRAKSKSRRSKSKSGKKDKDKLELERGKSQSSYVDTPDSSDNQEQMIDGSEVAGDVGHPTEAPDGYAATQVAEEEGRDDKEQAERETDCSSRTTDLAGDSKRRNKYKHITSVAPQALRYKTRSSGTRGSREFIGHKSKYALSGSTTEEHEIEVFTSIEEAEEGSFVELDDSATASHSEGSDDDEENHDDDTHDLVEDSTISNFGNDDSEKIEYTIFELESKVSTSTVESSLASGSSAGSTYTGDNEHTDVEHTDNETLDLYTEDEGTTCDEGTFNEDEATFNEGELTGASEAELTGSDDDDDDDDDDNEDNFLFASFCQRPESSFDGDYNNDDDDNYRRHRRHLRRKERDSQEEASIFKCVSAYFTGGDDVEVFIEDKHSRHRRRRHRS